MFSFNGPITFGRRPASSPSLQESSDVSSLKASLLAPKNNNAPKLFPHRRFPIRTSSHPTRRLDSWSLKVYGAVTDELEIFYADLDALPSAETLMDPSLTPYGQGAREWRGADLLALLALAGVRGNADWLVVHSDGGYSVTLELDRVFEGQPVLAREVNKRPLSSRDGGPLRLMLPHCHARFSAKWVRALELRDRLPA